MYRCFLPRGTRKKWLFAMKNFILFMFVFSIQVNASVFSQQKLNLKLTNVSGVELVKAIEKQTNLGFIYDKEVISKLNGISVDASDETVEDVLGRVLDQVALSYEISNNVIIIKPKETNPSAFIQQEKKTITGKVTDTKGEPIPGANVILVGYNTGTITDTNGEFELNVPDVEGVVRISFIGFKIENVNYKVGEVLKVLMTEDVSDIDEVQVVAYGESSKREMTGSVSVVKADAIKSIPTPNISNLLQGRVAGMDVTNVSGAPGGGGTQITIRGYNSLGIEAGRRFSNPLWVVDGVPMTSFTSPVTGTNGLSDLNPEVIESIHVLKDASATSLYGSRAANGVILVTTKKGKKNQKGQFSVNFSQTYSVLPEYPTVYGGKGERDYRIQSRRAYKVADFDYATNSYKYPESYTDVYGTYGKYDRYWGNGSAWSPEDGDELQDSLNTFWNNSTNFYKELFDIGKVTNANIQTYGGSENTSYSIGLGYYDEEGIVRGTGFNRINVMGNFTAKPVKNLSVSFNNYLSMSDRSRGAKGSGLSSGEDVELVPGEAYEMSTLLPYNSDVTKDIVEQYKKQQEKNTSYRLRSSFRVQYDISKNLNISNTTSIDYSQNNRNSFIPAALDYYKETKTIGEIARQNMFLNESLLNYKKSFNTVHNFELMAGLSFQRDEYNYIGGSAKNGPSDKIHYAGGDGWPDIKVRSEYYTEGLKNYQSDYSEKKMNSYFGRLNYNFKDKYFFTATVRRDGSSVFGDNLKWATFPSFAASWNFSEEEFMHWAPFLDFGKLRASYGLSGNTFKNPYLSYGLMEAGDIYGGNPTLGPNRDEGYYNPNLSWEETKQFDLGLDLNFFNYKLSVTADYYNRYTDKLLYKVPIPGNYTGYISQWRNAAAISNEGIELEVKYDVFRKDNNYWRFSFNIAKNWNRFVDSWNGKDFYDSNEKKYYILGKKLNGIMGYKTDGYWQAHPDETAYYDSRGRINYYNPNYNVVYYYPGTTKFQDVNGDFVLDGRDQVYLGSSLPDVTGGIINEVKWRNFDLNILLAYSLGRDMIHAQPVKSLQSQGTLSPIFVNLDKATFWQKPGDNTDYPVAHYVNYNRDWEPMQDKYVETVNYLKLKTLTLGYTMPKSLLDVKFLNEVRFFFSGENLFTWTNYSGIDPETVNMTSGVDYGTTYPLARKLTLGVTIKL